ncbi:hypothetical protein GC163_03725 [bacterium]|nr:hypothetical protein [bacterium]
MSPVGVSRWRLAVFAVAVCVVFANAEILFAKEVSLAQAELADGADPFISAHRGQVAVMIRHLPSGAEFGFRADEPMPTASLIKFPVMIAAYQQATQGKLDLKKMVTFRDADRTPGSGILTTHFSEGLQLSVRDAIRLMIAYSDNTATNLVIREIGLNTTNDCMGQFDCPQTRIHACVYHPETSISPADSQKYGLGKTTAREMVQLLTRLQRGELIDAATSQTMREHLQACDDQSRLGSLLPEGTRIAMKTGSTSAVRTVAGLIDSPGGTIAICVLTAENRDRRWTEENAGQRLSAEIARIAWKVFNPETPAEVTITDGLLKSGSSGLLVEDLQRTINAKFPPDQQITVDGDFGPQTEQALKLWQKQSQLPETGVTDPATWKSLGPLVSARDEPSDPHDVPAVELRPADQLDGPPIVSCRAWIVGDAAEDQVFGAVDADTPRDFASTTKIMTAYVVLLRSQTEPELLKEIVTISPLSDSTPGSSAHLRAGESLPMSELLRGLMLPSGNDAAMAIAEHMGRRLSGNASLDVAAAVERFVQEMNQTAVQIPMPHTRYVNPHGLTHADHRSSVRDQYQLTRSCLKLPAFRELVRTRDYRSTVQGPGGYEREVVWTNTNRLLNQAGFAGVKTGTTQAAGACLVSLCQREGKEAIAVVFGATSTDGRYIDSRNLFRWYWQNVSAMP